MNDFSQEFINSQIYKILNSAEEFLWINPYKKDSETGLSLAKMNYNLDLDSVIDAEKRLQRFAPFIRKYFPETEKTKGIIESEICDVSRVKETLKGSDCNSLFIKLDSELPVAGSVKARGGVYEVLKHTENLALKAGFITSASNSGDYENLSSEECRKFFQNYSIHVGSTGNLGLSIGIISAAIGYKVTVHMSSDARQWKKDLLRAKGVTVREYESDYTEAVKQGRKESAGDSSSYFVDDENSKDLFLGYAVAALRLKNQLVEKNIIVSADNPLYVYLPCGVGGAPSGITFGLKLVFGDNVHCFFVEPVQAPCMLLGLSSRLNEKVCVQDIGLTGITEADGLAVGRPSSFAGRIMEPFLDGCITVTDENLKKYQKKLYEIQGIYVEPSAAAGFAALKYKFSSPEVKHTGLVWATGGKFVPENLR